MNRKAASLSQLPLHLIPHKIMLFRYYEVVVMLSRHCTTDSIRSALICSASSAPAPITPTRAPMLSATSSPISKQSSQSSQAITMRAIMLLAACCSLWLPLSLQAVLPLQTALSAELCRASQDDFRIMPASGFTRSVEQPFLSTTASAPSPAVAELADCQFVSFDTSFDRLFNSTNPEIYQVGPIRTEPWAVESPSYLEGTPCFVLKIASGTLQVQLLGTS